MVTRGIKNCMPTSIYACFVCLSEDVSTTDGLFVRKYINVTSTHGKSASFAPSLSFQAYGWAINEGSVTIDWDDDQSALFLSQSDKGCSCRKSNCTTCKCTRNKKTMFHKVWV